MGYNRSGTRRHARLKRRKRHETRLAVRAEQEQGEGIGTKVKKIAKAAVEKVEEVAKAAVQKVKDVVS